MQQFAYDINNLFANKIISKVPKDAIEELKGSYIEKLYALKKQQILDGTETLSLEEVYEVLTELGMYKRNVLNTAYSGDYLLTLQDVQGVEKELSVNEQVINSQTGTIEKGNE